MIDFSKTLFRCSSLSHIMTEPKSKADKDAGNLSETAKTHLIDIYVSRKYNRQTDIQNRYIQKGLMVEEDGITLYSRIKKAYFKKNNEQLKNAFIQGHPDLYKGESIFKADHITDIKCSWDIFTFFRTRINETNKAYYWQLQGYMALSGAKTSSLAYCLIDTPEILINDEKRKLLYKMGVISEANPDYQEACVELDKLMRYEDISITQRMFEEQIERNDTDMELCYKKIEKCRLFLKELEEKFNPEDIDELKRELAV